jgi:hypothetical protein
VTARELLVGRGYDISLDNLSADEFARFAEHAAESGFVHARSGLKVDLHWRLLTSNRILAGIGAQGPEQSVAIPGGALRTLGDEALVTYLSVHGALHNWSRLKWLADLGAILAQRSASEIARLYDAAAAWGAGRCMAVALLLCRRLFDLPLDAAMLARLGRDRRAGALVEGALATLGYGDGVADPATYSPPWLREKTAQFFIAPGLAHQVDQLRVIWNCPMDRARIALPRGLGFAYHLIRVPLWLGRIGAGLFERARA